MVVKKECGITWRALVKMKNARTFLFQIKMTLNLPRLFKKKIYEVKLICLTHYIFKISWTQMCTPPFLLTKNLKLSYKTKTFPCMMTSLFIILMHSCIAMQNHNTWCSMSRPFEQQKVVLQHRPKFLCIKMIYGMMILYFEGNQQCNNK